MSRMPGPRHTTMLTLLLAFGLLLSGAVLAQTPTPIPVITSPSGGVPSVPTVPGGLPSLPIVTSVAPAPASTEESQPPAAPAMPANADTPAPPRVPLVVASGCPAQVQAALSAAQITCGQVGGGEACLGSGVVEASPQEGAQIRFTQPGDRASFSNLTELRLRTLDTSEKTLALVVGRPIFPTTSGSTAEATMIVIGDVTLVDDGDQRPSASAGGVIGTVIADFGLNVRRRPDPASEVVWQLRRGDLINITGQTADKTWYRMEIPNQFRAPAWVYAPYIQVSGNIPIVDPSIVPTRTAPQAGATTLFQAMQAFNLLSGSVNAECVGAPPSGALIQTPNGMFDRMRLRVNDVLIELNGTMFLQAQANDNLLISVLEGDANITAQGAMSSTPKGFRASVALGGNLEPQGAPLPDSFDQRELIGLPVSQLPRMIELALLQQEMAQSAPAASGGFSAPPVNALPATNPLPTLAPAVGSLVSPETGELCGAPEATLSGVSSGLGPAVEIGGLWRATAGTTISISASGGTFQPLFGDYVRMNSTLGILARSGQEQTLTHTFSADSTFSLLISAAAGNTVTVRVRCGA
ncbi:MAG: SH3 domain-containing protein [Anaerolineae bacterium]|nr:SH3 domain-containing protein [Anaerolineae bacterium]MDW8173775.1 SH3 domain-containing protein [Anaerolineae bacterium]